MTLIEAFELLAQAEQLAPRLEAAKAALAKKAGLATEKTWLDEAARRLAAASDGIDAILTGALRLEELESVRGDRGRMLQVAAVDALDRFHAGITFAGGARSPLLDALYLKLKVPPLRKCSRDEFDRFWVELEKRIASGYVRRMLADETYVVVAPALAELRAAVATWRSVFTAEPLSEDEAAPIRAALEAAAARLDVPVRQARLLAQAALLATKEILDETGLAQKSKRRAEEDTHPILEEDPPRPDAPTEEERAEMEAAF